MAVKTSDVLEQIDNLLNLPQQLWLLGAGVSKDAGIPLMYPLTKRVSSILNASHRSAFERLKADLEGDVHVEHILSYLGDLVAIASRCKSKSAIIEGKPQSYQELYELYAAILLAIRDTLRWGYAEKSDHTEERVGTEAKPILTIEGHTRFVQALFSHRRANLDRRPPVAFFTTNYDTLLEDALALSRIPMSDGFSGGAMAFWHPDGCDAGYEDPFSASDVLDARVFKLHGSIDWYANSEDIVIRLRDGAGYPPEAKNHLLIYPQATKYQVTQRDPFASLFRAFRKGLEHRSESVLIICGYSFGDDHINEEIERALRQRENKLSILAFVRQSDSLAKDEGFCPTLARWLSPSTPNWKEKLVIAGSHGVYHGSLENQLPAVDGKLHKWWTFSSLTEMLKNGPSVAV